MIAYNKRSLRYAQKCGYQKEGILKNEVYKKGRYYDVVLLAVFKKDFMPLWRAYQKRLLV